MHRADVTQPVRGAGCPRPYFDAVAAGGGGGGKAILVGGVVTHEDGSSRFERVDIAEHLDCGGLADSALPDLHDGVAFKRIEVREPGDSLGAELEGTAALRGVLSEVQDKRPSLVFDHKRIVRPY